MSQAKKRKSKIPEDEQRKQMFKKRKLQSSSCDYTPSNTKKQTANKKSNHLTMKSDLKKHLATFEFKIKETSDMDPRLALYEERGNIETRLKHYLKTHSNIKAFISMKVKFMKESFHKDEDEFVESSFRGLTFTLLKNGDQMEVLDKSFDKIIKSFEKFQNEGSNWAVDKVLNVSLHTAVYKPIKSVKYENAAQFEKKINSELSTYIPLPFNLSRTRAFVNVKNIADKECFKWSILAALYPVAKDAQRVTKYKDHKDSLNFHGLNFPFKPKYAEKFEELNPEIEINIFRLEKSGEFYPLHITKFRKRQKHINLLYFSNGTTYHYCWIKNFDTFMGRQKKDRNQYFYCMYCLHGYTKKSLLENHMPTCNVKFETKVEMPSEEKSYLSHKELGHQLQIPYVIYADFECLQIRPKTNSGNQNQNSEIKFIHKACGFAYKVIGPSVEKSKPVFCFRGKKANYNFLKKILEEEIWIKNQIKRIDKMKLTPEDEVKFQNEKYCHVCSKTLENDRVRDHDHQTGKYRGAAHKRCNLNFKYKKRIPVIFHNLQGYDGHIIMQALGKYEEFKNLKVSCIPLNMERYISFTIGSLTFIDSYLFLRCSLSDLVKTLSKNKSSLKENFKYTMELLRSDKSMNKLTLLLRKQVYPYDYMDSDSKFAETQLPSIKDFTNSVKDEAITEDDYKHANKVWKKFEIKSLGEYHDLYVKCDVLLLTDTFENFRQKCMKEYDLDPTHFYTTPGFSLQAALKMTRQNLDLLTDIDMYTMIENGIRGGVAMISKRFARANIPGKPGCKKMKPKTYIIYYDANNLYGWAMSQHLPTGNFKWLEPTEDLVKSILSTKDDDDVGYILEVDLKYPASLHDEHDDFPLAPEKIEINENMLSPYAKDLLLKLGVKQRATKKLVPNLRDKEKYVIHYRALKLYISLGLKLKKVHRIISFRQKPWLKCYMEFNTMKRSQTNDDFEKNFFKLMNNSVFGKTLENKRKHRDVQLISSVEKLKKEVAKPNFHSFKLFDKYLVAVELKKKKIKLDKPYYIGFSVLDISKTMIYDFHYNYIKKKYGKNAKLLFTDTDSLCYQIATDNVYNDMKNDTSRFDFSNYRKKHFLYSDKNKMVVGKMKDETNGKPIEEFVGLRPKMYSLKCRKWEKKAAQGVNQNYQRKHLRHDNYYNCLFSSTTQKATQTRIQTRRHHISTVEETRYSLSPYDDKRFILKDGISSRAYFNVLDAKRDPGEDLNNTP